LQTLDHLHHLYAPAADLTLHANLCVVEVYPRPDGTIYICGIGGSDYVSKEDLKEGAFREICEANELRVAAAKASFQEMSSVYKTSGELDRSQACMRPCPPDAMPYMGSVPGYEGAYINAGHNCWCVSCISDTLADQKM
jgi:glycine/D-amino acid oxidase-like deaminating enzyme